MFAERTWFREVYEDDPLGLQRIRQDQIFWNDFAVFFIFRSNHRKNQTYNGDGCIDIESTV